VKYLDKAGPSGGQTLACELLGWGRALCGRGFLHGTGCRPRGQPGCVVAVTWGRDLGAEGMRASEWRGSDVQLTVGNGTCAAQDGGIQ